MTINMVTARIMRIMVRAIPRPHTGASGPGNRETGEGQKSILVVAHRDSLRVLFGHIEARERWGGGGATNRNPAIYGLGFKTLHARTRTFRAEQASQPSDRLRVTLGTDCFANYLEPYARRPFHPKQVSKPKR